MIDAFDKDPALERYIKSSLQALEVATQFHVDTWSIDRCSYWSLDQDNEKIYFYFNDGTKGIEVSAPVQIVGIYSLENNRFSWAWDNPAVEANLQQAAKTVKKFAENNNYMELLTQSVACTEMRAWQYTAIAMRLSSYIGAYKAQYTENSLIFMIFNNINIQHFELTDL